MKLWEKITILFWLFFAFIICYDSSKLEIGNFANPGPGFLPFLLGLLLGFLSLLLHLKNRIGKAEVNKEETIGEIVKWKKVFWALGTLLFYALLLDLLGFLSITFITLVFLYKKMGDLRWRFAFVASLLTDGSCYLIFQLWLSANLPKGPLGF